MSESEKNTCAVLLQSNYTIDSITQKDHEKGCLVNHLIAQKRIKISDNSEKYRNCSFVFGSTVKVERLWPYAKNILCDSRKCETPLQFESILF